MPKVSVILLIFVASCSGQAPADGAKSARVEGNVLSSTGEPVRRVSLSLTLAGNVYAAESGPQGSFVFEDVAPGRYFLFAQRTGFVPAQYPTTVILEPGQSLTGILLKMTPQGILAGRVIDEEGEPFNARVMLYRSRSGIDGTKQLVRSGNATTDADGAFVIGNLTAGAYYVAASANALGAQAETRNRKNEVAYVTTFYPEATAASDGVPISVTAGGQSRGFVIRMRRVSVFRITGKAIIAATGQPASNPSVNLIPRMLPGIPGSSVQAAIHDGVFEFDRVLPGNYLLQATPEGMSSSGVLVGRQEITVKRGDLDGVLLQIVPAAQLAGRITVESGTVGPLPPIQIVLGSAEGISYGLGAADSAADGTFLIRGLEPAPFLLNLPRLPPNTYLKTVRYAGRDVTSSPVDFSGGAGLLEITLSAKAAMVTGVVHDATGAPLPQAWAALWNPGDGQPGWQAFQSVQENGRFLFTSLKPGDYKLIVFAAGLPNDLDAYDWIDKFADRALAVKVEEGSQQALDPPVITPD